MIIIENENLKAVISPLGAELQSLFNKKTGIEHMWSGDANYWGKHSPVLFPIVGALKNDTYYYNDKPYSLPRHGFARERTFLQDQISKEEAVFTLTQDAESLAVYPFAFTLKLHYKLQNDSLTCTYEVLNTGYTELLFSVGGHPAFAVPMVPQSVYTDYYLEFNNSAALYRWKLEEGLIAANAVLLPTTGMKLFLQQELFYADAIVLKSMPANAIKLASNKHGHGLIFTFENFPFFGIWAAKNAGFVCLEPWCGIADSVNSNQQLVNKEGIITLAINTQWQRNWRVKCF